MEFPKQTGFHGENEVVSGFSGTSSSDLTFQFGFPALNKSRWHGL